MHGKIPVSRVRIATVAVAIALGALMASAVAVSAAPAKVVYNDTNTVAVTVNGHFNEDTYSAAPFEFPYGGMVEFTHRPGVLKSLTAQVDSFTCEHGTYNLENCYTAHPSKKFSYELTASVYEVEANDEKGDLVATSTERFKIPYRPTTNVTCPTTPEGKGFGLNCDVGGYLATVKFKKFSPAAVLPEKAIILITNTASDKESDVVNVGVQTSYKEWDGSFVEAPPADGGVPSIGSDPLPEDAYVRGKLVQGGQAGFQPVFEITAKP
jgi:hypothetical protein